MENCDVSTTAWKILAHWCIWDLHKSSAVKINGIQKSKMVVIRYLEKSNKCNISATFWPILTKFGTVI